MVFILTGTAAAGGPFGPPQPSARETGGLHTAFGYAYRQDLYKNGSEYVTRQNQVYSELGYGSRYWDVYGRIGLSDLQIRDAFRSTQPSTAVSRNDFEDNWKLFGTLGAKGFLPFNQVFGLGAFVQGSYSFHSFTDSASAAHGGSFFSTELKVKDFWDVNFGLGLQAAVPHGIKLYAGPYVYYSEAKVSQSAGIPGLRFGIRDTRLRNKSKAGGFAGLDVPLAAGFHLNVEGQYTERFSVAAAITLTY